MDLGKWISFDVTSGAGATAWAQSVVGLGNKVSQELLLNVSGD